VLLCMQACPHLHIDMWWLCSLGATIDNLVTRKSLLSTLLYILWRDLLQVCTPLNICWPKIQLAMYRKLASELTWFDMHVLISHVPGEPLTFTVNVTTLRNLPLDLYILMDLSASMADDLDTVKAIAGQIGEFGISSAWLHTYTA